MKRVAPIAVLVMLSVLAWTRGAAQQILFRHYTATDGLCSNTVWAVFQDKQGYMWFGTKDGLNRFDGYSFKSFRYDPGDTASLGGNAIRTITGLGEDSCWICTDKGVYVLDMSQQVFRLFKPVGRKPCLDLITGPGDAVWIATDQGVYRYQVKTGRVTRFVHRKDDPNSLTQNFVRQLLVDDQGNIWMGTAWSGLDRYDPRRKTFTHYKATGEPGALSSNFITCLYKDSAGNIWVGTEKGGLDMWDRKTGRFTCYMHDGPNSISDNIVHTVYQPSPGKLYVGTEKGLDVLDIAKGSFTNYACHANDPYGLNDNAVYVIYGDRQGGIWAGTYFGGVNYFCSGGGNFEFYYPTGAPGALSGKAVSAMLQGDSTHIWIGTEDGGLNYFDTRDKSFRHFPFTGGQKGLSYHNVHALMKDRDGKIWIGTFTGGINVYDPSTGKLRVYKFGQQKNHSTYSNMIYALFQDSGGTIWAGTVGGLYRYVPAADSFQRVESMNLDRSWIYDIYEDDDGDLYFATYNHGLVSLNESSGNWRHYGAGDTPGSLSSEKVICLEASGDSLWIGTDGGGLDLLETSTGKVTVFTSAKGLDADVVYGILPDDKGHLWLSTNNGLFDFDPRVGGSRHYTQWDHLQSSQFNYKSYLKASDGKFYFGGVQGFNAFYPDSIRNFSGNANVVLTGFQIFNEDVPLHGKKTPLTKDITYTRNLTLAYRQSMFSFEYAALDYVAPKKTLYAYKMDGYDKDWNVVGHQRKATYTNLPPGHYTFRVKATDDNGNWDDTAAQIGVTIRPPFYRTNLAYAIYMILVIGGIWLLRRIEMQRIRRKNQINMERRRNREEQEFYRQKVDFFTAMAHEIRTPLSLIIAPLEKLLASGGWNPSVRKQLEVMDENSGRLLKLTNQLLDFRRMESDVYEIHPEKIELVSFVQSLFSRFSSISFQKSIKFSIRTSVPQLEVQADPEALTKILSNLLFNAFKFTRTSVELSINDPVEDTGGESFFSVSVLDDGIGIPKEEIPHIFRKFYQVSSGNHEYSNLGGNGIGLSLAKALTEKHGGKLLVQSTEGVRTLFTIVIPFDTVAPAPGVTAAADPDEEPTSGAGKKPQILVVEDDPALLEFIRENLAEEGFEVTGARNGAEALKRLERQGAELIVSDVMMPEMDGMELCRRVKQDVNYSHIPFILLTAKANPETEIQGLEEGADAYVTKPFKWKHISAVVNNLLSSRQRLKEKFSSQPFTAVSSLTTHTRDQKFLEKITEIIERRLDDQSLSVEELSGEVAMSRSSLHKKLKAISGHGPNEFIRIIRLKHAARLLLENEHSISEIGYLTGFNSPSYFSKCFYQQFQLTPREFIEKNQVPG